MKNLLSTLFLILLSLSSCIELPDAEPTLEEKQRSSYAHFEEVLEWECEEFESDYFLKGTLNGEPICFGEEVDGYETFGTGSSLTFTTTGTFYLGEDGQPDYRFYRSGFKKVTENNHLIPKLSLESPYFGGDADTRQIFEDSFIEGEYNLAENLISISAENGFSLVISGAYFSEKPSEYSGGFSLDTAHGPQDNSTFKITKVTSRYEREYEVFDIEAEVDCNMYHHQFNLLHDPELYGRLQAEMRLQAKFLLDE